MNRLHLATDGKAVVIYQSSLKKQIAYRRIVELGFCPLKCSEENLRLLVRKYGATVKPLL